MTGIERLRELIDAVDNRIILLSLRNVILDIADQIERELQEERDRWDEELCEAQMDKHRVMAVYLEMNKHVSGVEGAEDSPVARWARELRYALKSDMSNASDAQNPSCADAAEMADVTSDAAKVTRDPADGVSMSAYDLLPEDERDAVAWVREHGGLGAVKDEWNNRRTVKQQLENAQSKVERQQRHIESIQSKLAERRGRIADLECERDELRTQVDAMRPRLMPEGMEWLVEAWPRFEDDAPVRFLDDFERYGEENSVSVVTMYSDGSFALNCRAYSKGERVNRPAPKLLDADGAEIRVGDTVWCPEGWYRYVVTKVTTGSDGKELVHARYYDPDILTCDLESTTYYLRPYQLTHERPEIDSWERLEEDAGKDPCDYFGFDGDETCGKCPASAKNCEQTMARDLVRRAKKLAERDA